MDEDFIMAKTIFALVGALVIFGIILLANASLGSIWGVAKLVIGILMMGGGIFIAMSYVRRE